MEEVNSMSEAKVNLSLQQTEDLSKPRQGRSQLKKIDIPFGKFRYKHTKKSYQPHQDPTETPITESDLLLEEFEKLLFS